MDLTLRKLAVADAPALAAPFRALGWPGKTVRHFASYAEQQRSGQRDVVVAWLDAQVAGYGCVVWSSDYPPFRDDSVPEIQDLNVLPAHRRQGVGTALLGRHHVPTTGLAHLAVITGSKPFLTRPAHMRKRFHCPSW